MTKNLKILGSLCWLVYFASYLTRINYGAVISEIVISEGFLKSAAGIVTTVSFISYGTGQILSGFLGDRVNPRLLIFWGLIATSILNILMPFCKSVELMSVVWFINGFAQAMMWPPLVKIMACYLDEEMFKKTCVNVSIASSVGTIFVYLISPLCIAVYGWQLVFFVSAFFGLITAFIWAGGQKKIESQINVDKKAETQESSHTNVSMGKIILSSGLIFMAAGIIFQGILRDGITTWMPSFISETYNWGSSAAIFSTVILPVFSMISVKLAALIQRKFFKNELVCATVIFASGFICCILLSWCFSGGALLSIILAALITGCMHGVNIMLVSIVPSKFEKYGRVSTVSGVLNFFTYMGSAVSSYGIAKISEVFGWSFTLTTWSAAALVGTLACLVCIKKWKSFTSNKITNKLAAL